MTDRKIMPAVASGGLIKKQAELHNKSMNIMEKKLLRKAIESMHPIATTLECLPYQLSISMQLKENNDLQLIVANTVNGLYADVTHDAQAMQHEFPVFQELCERLQEIIIDLAKFWGTSRSNVQFVCWLDGMGGKLIGHVKPKKGFPKDQLISLSE